MKLGFSSKWRWLSVLALIIFSVTGCGHTDEEMAAKQREIDKLAADLKAARAEIAKDQKKFDDAQSEIESLQAQLKEKGMNAAKLQQAIDEYKQRLAQQKAIEQRFRDLRNRLQELTKVGLKVVVRNNRMVIQLPGDVLFDSGSDKLKQGGKDVLAQVAKVVRGDPDLSKRNFQVAGHTDNQPYGSGPFHDNWGLSLSRARTVLLYLITPQNEKNPKKAGGGLSPKHWAAAGYGETDPVAGTMEKQSTDERQKNRRVELVVQPNVEEMLNLSSIK